MLMGQYTRYFSQILMGGSMPSPKWAKFRLHSRCN